jgi:hypothetical protein
MGMTGGTPFFIPNIHAIESGFICRLQPVSRRFFTAQNTISDRDVDQGIKPGKNLIPIFRRAPLPPLFKTPL